MDNDKVALWTGLIYGSLALVYGIFMLMYLNDAKKCDPKLSKRDREFRKVAVVVTWIEIILSGLSVLACLIALLAGLRKPASLGEQISLSPIGSGMSEMGDMAGMRFY